MKKDLVINSLRFNYIPNKFELEIIRDILSNSNTAIIDIFNLGKQCGIRQERACKKK